jgi:outer membrane biosynthesis protein TonB
MMRILLGAILGIATASSPLLARQEPAEKEKQKQQEPRTHEPQPAPKANPEKKQEPPEKKQGPPSAKQEKSDEKRQQQDAKQQQKETEKQSKDNEKKTRENSQPPQQAQTQQRQQNNRQPYAQGSHRKGERIPPQKFDESFGSEHHFRVKHLQEGRRFEYSGYAFEVVEPWPAGWSYDDECYIEQDEDDYYLVDVFHPGIRVLVIVV